MKRLLIFSPLLTISCSTLAKQVDDHWMTKAMLVCDNGMRVAKYSYNHTHLDKTTMDISVNEKTVRTVKGAQVFDHWDSTLDTVGLVHFKYDAKAYNIYIQDSKSEGLMHYDNMGPAVPCAVVTDNDA